MKHPVVINADAVGTAHRAEFRDWLAANGATADSPDVPGSLLPLIFTGNTVVELPDRAGALARGWTLRRPLPPHLLAVFAVHGALSCTARSTPDRRPCALPVTADGTHPDEEHRPALVDGGPPPPRTWSIELAVDWPWFSLPRRPRNRAALIIGEDQLTDIIRIPAGQRIIGFEPNFLTLSLAVHLEGEGLPECPESSEPWRIGGGLHRQSMLVTATDPVGIHRDVLAALATPTHLEGFRSYQARVRLLDRHRPHTTAAGTDPFCGRCCNPEDHDQYEPWPCADYRDAAAPVPVLAWTTNDPTDSEEDQP